MFFRAQKKGGGELSLSEQLEADGDGDGLSLIDTLADETDMAEDISTSELCRQMLRTISGFCCLGDRIAFSMQRLAYVANRTFRSGR